MTNHSVFIDTNVFVYSASQGADDVRTQLASDALDYLALHRTGRLSPQVVGEFLRACSKPSAAWLSIPKRVEYIEQMTVVFELVPLDARTTAEALRAHRRYGLDYWDAQIWAAARMSGCDAILTEDTHGNEIEGVRYVNPFEPGFDAEALLRD